MMGITTTYQQIQVFGLKFPATVLRLVTMADDEFCNKNTDDGRTLLQLPFNHRRKIGICPYLLCCAIHRRCNAGVLGSHPAVCSSCFGGRETDEVRGESKRGKGGGKVDEVGKEARRLSGDRAGDPYGLLEVQALKSDLRRVVSARCSRGTHKSDQLAAVY
jgi:hypothetical protein